MGEDEPIGYRLFLLITRQVGDAEKNGSGLFFLECHDPTSFEVSLRSAQEEFKALFSGFG